LRYIFKITHKTTHKNNNVLYLKSKILFFIPLFILFQYNCSKNEIISKNIEETVFVTKKDAFLYDNIIDKNIVDEIPAFVKIITKEKIILINKSNNEKIYYKTNFNKNQGWVESIYLANIKKDVLKNKKPATNNKTLKKKPRIIIKPKLDKSIARNKPNKKKIDTSYFVQIASFKNENNAKTLFKKIQLQDIELSLEKINTPKGTFYRLITDSYENKNTTSKILKSIMQKHPYLKPIIKTSKINNAPRTRKKPIINKNGKTEYYTIQISSFENKKSAEKLAKKMTLAGYPSRVTEAWIKEKTWFRVQHGEYKMLAVAKQISNKIKNKFKFSPWISNIYK
tara:strand:+ start:1577 stop:2593 length:1017 start_codon:yes stop_codon:yes gene_type:complete